MKIAFIGCGNMGKAIISGLKNNRTNIPFEFTISAFDPLQEELKVFAKEYGIEATTTNLQAIDNADIIVLAVKPQSIEQVLPPLKGHIKNLALIVSICAGVPIKKIQNLSGHQAIVRAMPNTPAQIGQSNTVWTSSSINNEQEMWALNVLKAIGISHFVGSEDNIDKATAISGSGPAYVFYFTECLVKAALELGFDEEMATTLAINTVAGAASYAQNSTLELSKLRENVTSKGGTTEAALKIFDEQGLESITIEAAKAAYRRARELSVI
ncbi:MAG: pyrroline-5-carboxylate reductase [Chloroflexi bacterium]|nr:pyrroline-5-carboxylate reductase [Chloroflexota bacterium]